MQNSTPAPALRQARQHLMEFGCPPSGVVNERLALSWQRSLAAGLQPMGKLLSNEHASGGELRQTLARNHELLAHSRPVMEYLFDQVRHAQSIVILSDERGMLMHTLGDPFFLNKAERIALATGACWLEEQRGTNAIGTAIAEHGPVQIHGAEHFLDRNGFLTCSAAPIRSYKGELMGILDISCDHRNGSPQTLGLVTTAVRLIENRLMISALRRNVRLHIHRYAEGIGTVAEGIVAVADDGWIIGANRAGLTMLRMADHQIGALQLSDIVDTRLNDLLTQHRRRPDQPVQVQLRDGSVLFMQIHHEPGLTTTLASGAAPGAASGPTDRLSELDTGDEKWRAAAAKVRRVIDKPIPVVIQGESGVGKELFARATHDSSQHREGAFVAINCAAMPESLIEAELFGYEPGAFTGARKEGRAGRIREANGGTLFLDEIGDMPLGMQGRLLRVLQEREVTPLGGGRSFQVDFSLVCATNRNLRDEVAKGTFREDLFYRINGLTLHLPALRERTDFAALSKRLLNEFNPERDVCVDPDLFGKMRVHAWPGNIRQLASVLRTASAMLDDHEDCIGMQHLPDDIADDLLLVQASESTRWKRPEPGNLRELSRHAVQQALESSRGNISSAARFLGISRQTLYRKIGELKALRSGAGRT